MSSAGNSNSPGRGGSSSGSANASTSASSRKPAPVSSGGAGALLEGLERRMANKKDGAAAVHVLLPEENDEEEEDTSTTSSGDDDEVVTACAGNNNGPSRTAGSTNIVATSAPYEDEAEAAPSSPYRRRSRADNELTFLQGNLYPKEYGKTALALLLVLLAAMGNGLVIAYIHQLGTDRHPLRDVVFELVPYQRWAWTVADVMVTISGVFCLLVAFFHKHNSIVIRRTALLAGVLYFLRALFLLCTYLPPPFPDADERCLPRWNISSDPLQFMARAVGLVFTIGFTGNSENKILCGDTIYSGHTMIYILSGMVVWNYCPRPWRPLVPILMVVAVIFGLTAVLISRQHYTIDVVVALFVTVSIFYGYHVWCRQRRDRVACKGSLKSVFKSVLCKGQRSTGNVRRKRLRFRPIYAIFLYFERRVPHGLLDKELAWPLPWPVAMVTFFENWNAYGARVVTVMARPASSPLTAQRRLKKRERKSSSSGGSTCGDSRHALTSSNSGLLNAQNGHHTIQHQQTHQQRT